MCQAFARRRATKGSREKAAVLQLAVLRRGRAGVAGAYARYTTKVISGQVKCLVLKWREVWEDLSHVTLSQDLRLKVSIVIRIRVKPRGKGNAKIWRPCVQRNRKGEGTLKDVVEL